MASCQHLLRSAVDGVGTIRRLPVCAWRQQYGQPRRGPFLVSTCPCRRAALHHRRRHHGVGLIITQTWLASNAFDALSETLPTYLIATAGWVFTFNYVILGFAFTKHENLADTLQSWGRIFGYS